MSTELPKSRYRAAPIFKLYGESRDWPTPDLVHCESIAERSRLHHWEISPHSHNALTQLVYLAGGAGSAEVDGVQLGLQPPSVLLVPETAIHAFRFSSDVEGSVITLASPLIQKLADRSEQLAMVVQKSLLLPLPDNDRKVGPIITAIRAEYETPAPGREFTLEYLIGALLLCLSRQTTELSPLQEHDRGREHLARFSQLLEEHYTEHRPLDFYADGLGITTAHLNAICRRLADCSALELVHQRLLLEAKRNLVYTTFTVNQISDTLGFSEPAYFTRFFKRNTGLAPTHFRRRGLRTENV